ncbi:hypothetical protein WR25_13190 [Diploscapter pachys]|uniref:Uncharacterized protein n=1 Tax=Diploscapter pachys TaxID=2018661 RepID=A0A2A2KPT8_9BILA|nr:hypothetical protein WR25_13190 [Diploscapter pachys]
MAEIYEDSYVRLSQFTLVVKNYNFPTKKSKFISIDAIRTIWFEEQDRSKSETTKVWGKSSANIYWALDVKRCLMNLSPRPDKWNIVVDIGSKSRIGFTVANGSEFMEFMRNLVDYHTIIVNYINLP